MLGVPGTDCLAGGFGGRVVLGEAVEIAAIVDDDRAPSLGADGIDLADEQAFADAPKFEAGPHYHLIHPPLPAPGWADKRRIQGDGWLSSSRVGWRPGQDSNLG